MLNTLTHKIGFDTIFYVRYSWFQVRERFTDVGSSIGYLALYPFLIWLLTHMWEKFSAYQSNYQKNEIYVYIAITELLFLSFLRSPFMQRANADFSLSLARPRPWLLLAFFGQFGSTLGARLIYVLVAGIILFFIGTPIQMLMTALLRLICLLPALGIIEALMASVLASAQLVWHETSYLVLPITKIFLALGGVFCPLADYGEPGRSFFLLWPPSDIFFQVGHFCVKGSFYQLSTTEWCGRVAFWTVVFATWNISFFKYARRRHQSFGG